MSVSGKDRLYLYQRQAINVCQWERLSLPVPEASHQYLSVEKTVFTCTRGKSLMSVSGKDCLYLDQRQVEASLMSVTGKDCLYLDHRQVEASLMLVSGKDCPYLYQR